MRKKIFLPSAKDYKKFDRLYRQVKADLSILIPNLKIFHVGSTSVKGTWTKGDVDLNILCSGNEFKPFRAVLKRKYAVAQLGNWTDTFAGFETQLEGVDVGLQLAIRNGPEDFFLRFRRLLRNPRVRSEYNKAKLTHRNDSVAVYRRMKVKVIGKYLQ